MSISTNPPKTVLITGSSRGIGQAIALCFAHDTVFSRDASDGTAGRPRWNIVINSSHSPQALKHTAAQIRALGVPCLALTGDVGNYEVCAAMFEDIRKNFGDVDVLVNNAGAAHIGLFSDMTPHQWTRLIQTDLLSVFNCCHLAIPAMVRRHEGKIINISSVWGNVGASCEAVYSAAKGGVNAFTKALAKELGPSHIQVNAIACGLIQTEMNSTLSPQEQQDIIDEIPACRMGRPEEVARLVRALATGHEYLTGQVITLDGGWI